MSVIAQHQYVFLIFQLPLRSTFIPTSTYWRARRRRHHCFLWGVLEVMGREGLPCVHCSLFGPWCSRWRPQRRFLHSSAHRPTSAAERLWVTCSSSRTGSSHLTRQRLEMRNFPWKEPQQDVGQLASSLCNSTINTPAYWDIVSSGWAAWQTLTAFWRIQAVSQYFFLEYAYSLTLKTAVHRSQLSSELAC